ncbi:hypothetical protein [Ktedonobacter robiniae]|uniref:Helicase ATP-binding domain-containing protein n=1 Tax=Ktedonobacter robiniae TaxID=2778365 RepID=A0ABQ3UYL2_9CHLR|nr:hypothetical protein [Ktedonobacter robiniae]GHO57795.1 hypothetical protein KSB_62700 [Ktedonobacter robiniae]
MQGERFAVLIDEAYSSQSGESGSLMKKALTALSLKEAEESEREKPEDLEDRIVQDMQKRGHIPNASFFAFTATPKLDILPTAQAGGFLESPRGSESCLNETKPVQVLQTLHRR